MTLRCAAVLNVQHRCKIPMVQLCQQRTVFRVNGVPLCGTHINHPPEQVVVPFDPEVSTVEKIT